MKKAKRWREKSDYGVVSVYVPRHVNGCGLRDRNDVNCNCPKWLYHRAKGGRAVQVSAQTTSFTEASVKAKDILKRFDPEIAAAREKNNPTAGISIEDCLTQYESALGRRNVTSLHVKRSMLIFNRRNAREYRTDKGRAKNLSLLDFLDRENVAAREPVVRLDQITSDILDKWAAGWKTNDASSKAWRTKVSSFLKWALAHDYVQRLPVFRERQKVRPGNRCGHFSDEQLAKMYAGLPFVKMRNRREMPANYAERLRAFLDLGRWGGLALTDVVHFMPKVSVGKNDVLTYRRRKSGQVASVLLPAQVAARLRSIPIEAGCDAERPFRFVGTTVESNTQVWRDRFQNLCASVGITEIETELGTTQAHPHALRDTCAINAIVSGVSLDNVARMLGHASVAQTQKSYLFWVAKRDDASIADQRRGLERAAAALEAEQAEPEPEAEAATVN